MSVADDTTFPAALSSSQTVSEIQMIAVDVVHINEVQRFITYADPYETVGGFWRLFYPGKFFSGRGLPDKAGDDTHKKPLVRHEHMY